MQSDGFDQWEKRVAAAATKIQQRIKAKKMGEQVREQVRVRTESPGIIGVRVRNTAPLAVTDETPLGTIRANLDKGTEYNHLRVQGGAKRGGVFGPGTGEKPTAVSQIAGDAGLPD